MLLLGIPQALTEVFRNSHKILVRLALFLHPPVVLIIFQVFKQCCEEMVVEPYVEAKKDSEDAHCSPGLEPCPRFKEAPKFLLSKNLPALAAMRFHYCGSDFFIDNIFQDQILLNLNCSIYPK